MFGATKKREALGAIKREALGATKSGFGAIKREGVRGDKKGRCSGRQKKGLEDTKIGHSERQKGCSGLQMGFGITKWASR